MTRRCYINTVPLSDPEVTDWDRLHAQAALAVSYWQDDARWRSEMGDEPDAVKNHTYVLLTDLREIRILADRCEREAIEKAREDGLSWEQIGQAIGVSKQAAQQKYGERRS